MLKWSPYLFCDLYPRNLPFIPVCVRGFHSFSLSPFTGAWELPSGGACILRHMKEEYKGTLGQIWPLRMVSLYRHTQLRLCMFPHVFLQFSLLDQHPYGLLIRPTRNRFVQIFWSHQEGFKRLSLQQKQVYVRLLALAAARAEHADTPVQFSLVICWIFSLLCIFKVSYLLSTFRKEGEKRWSSFGVI